jgi:hypothetical protein
MRPSGVPAAVAPDDAKHPAPAPAPVSRKRASR